jgi:hypothetical protein
MRFLESPGAWDYEGISRCCHMNASPRVFCSSVVAVLCLMLGGCASIYERTYAYLGSPKLPPTDPAQVQILSKEPPRPKERLGEIALFIEGSPSREKIEEKLRKAASQLGADAVFITYDRMHVFPVVYVGRWGPVGAGEDLRRDLVAVAIKYASPPTARPVP